MQTLNVLRCGAAQADITPDWPIELAGFAGRPGPTRVCRHPLALRAVVLDHAGTRALILSADLLNWGPEQVAELRSVAADAAGVEPDTVLFSGTHTHSAPQSNRWVSPLIGVLDERYLELVADRVPRVAAAAAGALEPVTVLRSSRPHDLAMCRRAVENGRAVSRPNPDGPADRELTVVAFRRGDGSLVAGLVHYTCHPVLSNENELSGDFAGAAMHALHERHGGVLLYLQGCAGDQNPADPATCRTLATAGLAEVDRQADRFADTVDTVLSRPMRVLAPAPLRARWRHVDLPFVRTLTRAEAEAASREPAVEGDWGRAFLDRPDRIVPAARLDLQRLDLADGLGLLGLNAEATVAYGLDIRSRSGGTLLPVGYANGMVGYLPTAAQLREGGYESDRSCRYYRLPGTFDPRVESIVRTALTTLTDDSSSWWVCPPDDRPLNSR